jgi:bacteriocin-like protein
MNMLIQSQVEFELTDEQLANISGGLDHDDHHGHWGGDDDDHHGHWGGDDDHHHGHWGHCHPHWVWNRWLHRWEWVPGCER